MIIISANDLKKKGVSALADVDEALLTVRGKPRYVVLDLAHYEELREAELEIAIQEVKKDISKRKYISNITQHIKRITDDL